MAATHDEPSEHGARPLLEDSRLGWGTPGADPQPRAPSGPGGVRLASELAESEYKLRSNTKWIVLAISLAVVAAAAVVVIALTAP